MTARCEDLDPWFDRELAAGAAHEFREHLASCARCQNLLRGRMLEAVAIAGAADCVSAVGATAAAHEPAPPRPAVARQGAIGARARRLRWCAIGAAVAVAVVVLSSVRWPARPAPPAGAAIALADDRGVEVRFSAPVLDRHRRYVVAPAADPHEQIELSALAALERSGALAVLAGASALNGDLVSAERAARRLPRTAASLTDRAAIELLRDDGSEPGPQRAQTGAERALSLTADALRLAPGYAQAKWNQALALRRLGLSLLAARAFDDVAELHEAGWAGEARSNAELLRRDYQRTADGWRRIKADADQMIQGGAVLTERQVARAPSLARDAFYLAVATAATPGRLDELAALARALDAQFATTALGDLIARVRGSDLAARAPVAAELAAFIKLPPSTRAIAGLRSRAIERGARDIALASFLAVDASGTDDGQLAALDPLVAHHPDPWWRPVLLARRAFVLDGRRDYPAVDALARLAAPICKTIHSTWCARITRIAGRANGQIGRAELAIEQLTAARRSARDAAAPDDEIAALAALGQAVALRVGDELDASAVAGAYLEESVLRNDTCTARLDRLDFAAAAALAHHRFDEAARARHDADVLEQERCQDAGLRLTGETARVQLLLHGQGSVETLRTNLGRLEQDGDANQQIYLELLRAAGTLVEDRPGGEAALRRMIGETAADPSQPWPSEARALAFDLLVESVAATSDARAVLALLTERLGTPSFDRCALGVASRNRLVVAVLDASGRPALETRDIPDGIVMVPPSELVSPALRARLAGCRRVDVVTPGPYFGTPQLLGDDVAWVYRTGAPRVAEPAQPSHEVVVSDATPPDDLELRALQPFPAGPGAELLAGSAATPANVLAALATASLIVIVAHGQTDASEPTAASLILSPDPQGDYLLTAAELGAARLARAPSVVLAGCDAARVQLSAKPWRVATAFLAAGARGVLAPTTPVPDASAGEALRSLVERIRAGADPAQAVVDERTARPAARAWLSSIVVFE